MALLDLKCSLSRQDCETAPSAHSYRLSLQPPPFGPSSCVPYLPWLTGDEGICGWVGAPCNVTTVGTDTVVKPPCSTYPFFKRCFPLKPGFDFTGLNQMHIQRVILVCASTVDAGEQFIDNLMVSLKSCRHTEEDWVIRAPRIAMVSQKVSSHVHDSPPLLFVHRWSFLWSWEMRRKRCH